MNVQPQYFIDPSGIDNLLSALRQRGYKLIGPTVRDDVVVYDVVATVADLPVGWRDEQMPGSYRLKKQAEKTFFGFNLGPQSWKKILFPPALRLFSAGRSNDGTLAIDGTYDREGENSALKSSEPQPVAFIGVRPCELQAIAVQDKVFLQGAYPDAHYAEVRKRAFLVSVNCTVVGATCFCTSMNTGPKADKGFDLSLTEVLNNESHYFIVTAGSGRGEEIVSDLHLREATPQEVDQADRAVAHAANSMTKSMDTTNIREMLQQNLEHPRWNVVSERCLSCANCTLVCPTCFCHTIEDVTDLTGTHAERWRKWDSCFTLDFSYIHGGSIRTSRKSRYRQWLTHKLGNWLDQFGTSGCVGCGRCITWCPVGIDITEEVKALRTTPATPPIKNIAEVNNHGVA
jgi:ferredoxin